MVEQILWIDALAKAASSIFLLLIPRVSIAAFGLPKSDQAFYPRLLGGVFLGLAAAIVLHGMNGSAGGLGPAGAGIVNLVGSVSLITLMILPRPTLTLRGRIILWAAGAGFFVIGLAELLLG